MRRKFFNWAFKAWGWKVEGAPPEINKYVIVVAPHTSNMDFFVGLCVKYMYPYFKPSFMAKNSLFKIPLVGWFLKSIGGHPVDRSKKNSLVDQVVEVFNQKDYFVMTITPEGTRSYVPKWKTGFYYVALKAKVPIILAGFDYENKIVWLTERVDPSGDVDKDMEKMMDYFRGIKGKHPELGVR